jgi:predicted ATPase
MCFDTRLGFSRELGHIAALVGRNGAGKTTVLKGIEWICRTATSKPDSQYPSGAAEITFSLGKRKFHYEFENVFQPNRKESLSVDGVQQFDVTGNRGTVGTSISLIRPGDASLPILRGIQQDATTIQDAYDFLRSVRYYALDEPHDTEGKIVYIPDQDLAKPSSGEQDISSIIAYLFSNNQDAFKELSAILGETLNLVKITVSQNKLQRPDGQMETGWLVRFAAPNSNHLLPFGKLSFGTRRLIRIVTSVLLGYDQETVMMIEQIEEGLHSGLLYKLADTLARYSDPTQIILTSHSSHVLDHLPAKAIRLVARGEKEGVTSRALTEDELQKAQNFLENDGPLSEFLDVITD